MLYKKALESKNQLFIITCKFLPKRDRYQAVLSFMVIHIKRNREDGGVGQIKTSSHRLKGLVYLKNIIMNLLIKKLA